MSANEGVRRIEVLAKLMVFGGIGSGLIGAASIGLAIVADRFLPHGIEGGGVGWLPATLVWLAFSMIVSGGSLWTLAWILEGSLGSSE